MRPDRQEILADGQDVSLVEVQVLDKEDRLVPVAENEIMFNPNSEVSVGAMCIL